jgi:hypothetical protein
MYYGLSEKCLLSYASLLSLTTIKSDKHTPCKGIIFIAEGNALGNRLSVLGGTKTFQVLETWKV